MPNSPPSSPASGTCRLEWRPSRLLVVALVVLALTAAGAVSASALPSPWRGVLAALVALHGLLAARREAGRPACTVTLAGAGALVVTAGADAARLQGVSIDFRGPLVRLQGRDRRGRTIRLLWWPDTLDADGRRRLRRAARSGIVMSTTLPSMAA